MTIATTTTEQLVELLAEQHRLYVIWHESRDAADRLRMRAAWEIGITAPGSSWGGERVDLSTWTTCTPTVIHRDLRVAPGDRMDYRSACLGCGWVSDTMRQSENAAVEDAHDHTHPGWRDLPVVGTPPVYDSPSAMPRLLKQWHERWAHLLPDGWLESGGPIRTHRPARATRHVPGRAPGGGYDLAHVTDTGEATPLERPGGQLELSF
jgi:hypothetical protein